jgi:hypothetical protein
MARRQGIIAVQEARLAVHGKLTDACRCWLPSGRSTNASACSPRRARASIGLQRVSAEERRAGQVWPAWLNAELVRSSKGRRVGILSRRIYNQSCAGSWQSAGEGSSFRSPRGRNRSRCLVLAGEVRTRNFCVLGHQQKPAPCIKKVGGP